MSFSRSRLSASLLSRKRRFICVYLNSAHDDLTLDGIASTIYNNARTFREIDDG